MVDENKILSEIMSLIPQKPPFRFIDDIIFVDDKKIISSYTFKEDEYFYKGHFPGNPITPGVILIETMAQSGVVAQGIFLLLKKGLQKEAINQITTLFSLADDVEFFDIVKPGQTVLVTGETLFFRKGTLRSSVCIHHLDETLICRGILTGSGINHYE
ncbi:MAG: beta-hydroxyacyl-ACP dehydratase [Proteobacteria bacterium]|nr:beta-hydroxyacyl-ACP dehydratase [Pseudomonadota bacterium]